jgi:hypothetical protein
MRANRFNPNDLPIAIDVGGNAFSGQINKDYVWWKATFNNPILDIRVVMASIILQKYAGSHEVIG